LVLAIYEKNSKYEYYFWLTLLTMMACLWQDSLSSSLSPDSEAILPYNGLNYAHCQQFETGTHLKPY